MTHTIFTRVILAAVFASGIFSSRLPAQQLGAPLLLRASEPKFASLATASRNGISAAQQAMVAALSAEGLSAEYDGPAAFALAHLTNLQVDASWGMATIPLPNYLSHAGLGLAANQGLLVTQLIPGLPAANSGIEIGGVIIELDGIPVLKHQQLPLLTSVHQLTMICEGGIKEVCIKPIADGLPSASFPDEQRLSQYGAWEVLPQLRNGLAGFSVPGLPLGSAAPRSLAISQVNGEILVSAVVDGAAGPTRVELRGCRADIVQQLSELPIAIQHQLAPHIGL